MWTPSLVTLGTRLALNLSFILWLISVLLDRQFTAPHRITVRPYFWAFGLYLLCVFSSALRSPNHYESLQQALTIGSYAQGFVLAYALLSKPLFRKIFVQVLVGIAALMLVYGCLQLADLNFTPRLSAKPYTLSSFFYHYSHYAGYLALLVPLFFSVALFVGKRWHWLFLIVASVNLLLSFSWDTVAFVGFSCAVLFLASVKRVKGKQRLRFVYIALLACLAISVGALWLWQARPVPYLATPAKFQRLMVSKLKDRYAIFEGGFSVVAEKPLLGVGPGNFAYAYTKYKPSASNFTFFDHYVNHAHSDFLQIAAETGLLGLISYLGFWVCLLVWPASGWPPALSWGLRGGLSALFLCGSLDVTMTVVPASTLLAWLMAGALQAPLQKQFVTES
jgi:O-antigen ligase